MIMSVLLVGRDTENGGLIEAILGRWGIDVLCEASGAEALLELDRHLSIELVILDSQMVDMDSLELLSRIKSAPKWYRIPVIMCSTATDLATVTKTIELGCSDYLVKPIDPNLLVERVQLLLAESTPAIGPPLDLQVEMNLEDEEFSRVATDYRNLLDSQSELMAEFLEGTGAQLELDFEALLEGARRFRAAWMAVALEALASTLEEEVESKDEESKDLSLPVVWWVLREVRIVAGQLAPYVRQVED
jgi:DNA-binding response OmpR family regulator